MKQKKLLLLALLIVSIQVVAQHKIEITIKGIEKVKGTVLVAVYNSEDSFMKKHALSAKQKVSDKQDTVVIENVKQACQVAQLYGEGLGVAIGKAGRPEM